MWRITMDFSGGLNVGFVCDIVNRNWHWRKEDVGEKDCATVVCLPQCIRSGSERKLSHSFTHFSHWLGHSYSTHLNVKRHQDILKILFPLFAKYANWPYFSSRFFFCCCLVSCERSLASFTLDWSANIYITVEVSEEIQISFD